MKDKGFKILMGIYILAFIVDLVSTLMNRELVIYLESNPVFALTGGWIGIALVILINIALIVIFWYWYTNTESYHWRFYIPLILVTVLSARVMVIINNIHVYLNPPTIQQAIAYAEQATTITRVQETGRFVWVQLLPYLNGAIAWMFFKIDHIINRK